MTLGSELVCICFRNAQQETTEVFPATASSYTAAFKYVFDSFTDLLTQLQHGYLSTLKQLSSPLTTKMKIPLMIRRCKSASSMAKGPADLHQSLVNCHTAARPLTHMERLTLVTLHCSPVEKSLLPHKTWHGESNLQVLVACVITFFKKEGKAQQKSQRRNELAPPPTHTHFGAVVTKISQVDFGEQWSIQEARKEIRKKHEPGLSLCPGKWFINKKRTWKRGHTFIIIIITYGETLDKCIWSSNQKEVSHRRGEERIMCAEHGVTSPATKCRWQWKCSSDWTLFLCVGVKIRVLND